MARILIAGCGYVGEVTAKLFFRGGYEVTGLVRSQESAARLTNGMFTVHAGDLADSAWLSRFAGKFDAVIHCAAPAESMVEGYRTIYLEGARALLDVVQPQKFLFTSSTSVYAQMDGSDVDETSAAEPTRETGQILRETEELVLAAGGHIARVSGIYGPGRSAYLSKFLAGTATIEANGSRFVNQIHRDDVAGAIFYLIAWHCAPGIYNVSDDTPMTQLEVYRWLAQKFGRPLPPAAEVDLNRKRGWTNKRVSNAKLHNLGWRCRYPSYREALDEIVPSLVHPGRGGILQAAVA